jgi:hypothetical protein
MESISQLVSDSLARHGMEPSLDHLRLEWSRWFRCESSFSVLLVPAKPGIFALGEEMVPAGSDAIAPAPEGQPSLTQRFSAGEAGRAISVPEGRPNPAGKRMLALFHISEADDLGMALGRLFLPGNPLLRKLNSGRCFLRYAVIEDAAQRSASYATFQRWMQDSAETASGISSCDAEPALSERPQGESRMGVLARETVPANPGVIQERFDSQPSTSSAWGVGFMEVQNREAREVVRRPTPLPSGF